MAVEYGRERIDLTKIFSLGIDEIYWAKKSFLTVVYQIANHCKRLIWYGEKRTEATIRSFFKWFGAERTQEARAMKKKGKDVILKNSRWSLLY